MMEEDDDHKSYNQYSHKNLMDHQYHSMQTKQGINVFLNPIFWKVSNKVWLNETELSSSGSLASQCYYGTIVTFSKYPQF